MKRLSITGSSIVSPAMSERELISVLDQVGVGDAFNDAAICETHRKIGMIIGAWMANEESKQSSSVARALLAIGKNLINAGKNLSGHEDGFQTTTEIQVTSLTLKYLALDPTLDTDPQQLISNFCRDAIRIGNACLIAYADVSQKSGKDGRDALVWYDKFTALLLDIARKGHKAPTLGNDPINDIPCGWLFDAAKELELFLYPAMRSPSAAACGKRLQRSLERLGQAQGQKAFAAN